MSKDIIRPCNSTAHLFSTCYVIGRYFSIHSNIIFYHILFIFVYTLNIYLVLILNIYRRLLLLDRGHFFHCFINTGILREYPRRKNQLK